MSLLRDHSALVVLVPEAEAVVKIYRDRYDPSAKEGMPAHITVLSPFQPSMGISDDVLDQLKDLVSKHARFSFSLLHSRRFSNTFYLAPTPDEPFKRLTQSIAHLFPETPPYGGEYPDVVPHLTIADGISDADQLNQIATEFALTSQGKLPMQADAKRIWLMERLQGSWQPLTSLHLLRADFSYSTTPNFVASPNRRGGD
jgi:2'-5' RNA ligase